MTNEGAIKVLKGTSSLISQTNISYDDARDYKEASELAIEALEKQIFQKPFKDRYYIVCGKCGHNIPEVMKKGKMPYCPFCSQRIDWSEEE